MVCLCDTTITPDRVLNETGCMEFGFQYLIEVGVNHDLLATTSRLFSNRREKAARKNERTEKVVNGEGETSGCESVFRGLVICACFSRQRFACLLFFLGPRAPNPRSQLEQFAETTENWNLPDSSLLESKQL